MNQDIDSPLLLDHAELATRLLGFAFAGTEPGFLRHNASWLMALPPAIAVLLGAAVLVLIRTIWRDAPSRRAVIARHEPPAGIDMFLAAEMLGRQSTATAASLLDLSVRGNTRLLGHEVPLAGYRGLTVSAVHATPGAARRTVPVFGVQGVTDSGLTTAERRFASMIFPPNRTTGSVRWFDQPDNTLAARIVNWRSETRGRMVALGLRRQPAGPSYVLVIALMTLAVIAEAIAVLILVERAGHDTLPVAPALLGFAGTAAAGFLLIVALRRRPLTAEGREILDYLRGLELFLRQEDADQDRILQARPPQNPRGARHRAAEDAPGGGLATATLVRPEGGSAIRAYERLLPYAVLFGLHERWLATLARHYREAGPEWVVFGRHDIPLPVFVDSLSSFVSSMSVSCSGSDHDPGRSDDGGSSGGG